MVRAESYEKWLIFVLDKSEGTKIGTA